jgi:hypothetical protein
MKARPERLPTRAAQKTAYRGWHLHGWLALLLSAAIVALGSPAEDLVTITNEAVHELTGRLVPDSGARGPGQFKVASGDVYTLVSNRMSLALFTDTNLQSRTLVLKGRVLEAKPPRFEVTGNLRSIRAGRIHEIYYYCDICSIKGSDPGPCTCCREAVHLVEALPGTDVH